jgi:predicted GNAT superfamily acetyltransferase
MTLIIRNLNELDYKPLISVVDAWWGGRPMRQLLPRLFFIHFQPTSFVAENDGELQAFLIGFISQTDQKNTAYIHFSGVAPTSREQGLGRLLYNHFFEVVKAKGCTQVECITSPVNKTSIAFHQRMGFEILPGDMQVEEGIFATSDYDGAGGARILFRRYL